MSSDPTVVAQGLCKQYVLGGVDREFDTLRDLLANAWREPLRRWRRLRQVTDRESAEETADDLFWALKGVSFSIDAGDVVGVIGHNGAGKSTLLKILTRITAPTLGEVRLRGRVASLLEIGTGFHPELSGRENIYLNGAILGMSRAEVDRKFDEIVAFSEVEKFLDTPVKRYSSGMYVRLAFAVAAHLEVDILLVDEVLAVGDQEFQKRCLGKLDEVSKEGRTVFFVSHNLSMVARLCNRILVMDKGNLVFDGGTREGIRYYTRQTSELTRLEKKDYRGELFPIVRYDSFSVNGERMRVGVDVNPLEPIEIEVQGVAEIDLSKFRATMSVRRDGTLLFSQYDQRDLTPLKKGGFLLKFSIPAYFLMPGDYSFSVGGYAGDNGRWLWTPEYRFAVRHEWAEDYNSTSTVVGMVNIRQFGERISL